jgi:hypothetical protein
MTGGADEAATAPWRARLEVLALLLLTTVTLVVLARLVGAYDQAEQARELGRSIDLVQVVRLAGEQAGFIAAAGVLVAFLLVTLGPEGAPTGRGRFALRAATVLGLIVAGLCAFAGIAALAASSDGAIGLLSSFPPARSLTERLSTGVPLLLAAATAGYVAWCAFSTLGEEPDLLFPEADGDVGEVSEGRWDAPPPLAP